MTAKIYRLPIALDQFGNRRVIDMRCQPGKHYNHDWGPAFPIPSQGPAYTGAWCNRCGAHGTFYRRDLDPDVEPIVETGEDLTVLKTDHPINEVRWVPIEQVEANDYNPNSVAKNEMRLLYVSISQDGYTQPIVTIYDEARDKYVIVDGFHRYTTARLYPDILDSTEGCVPIVVIEKDINDRMASTVRHNRARGKHSIAGMGSMVFGMLENGATDGEIIEKMGLTVDELTRLKHVTGFSKLFENVEPGRDYITDQQAKVRREHKNV